MCNLNIFIKAKKQNKKGSSSLLSFLNNASAYSYIHNRDGEGVYFSDSDKLIKSPDKINLLSHSESIKKSRWVLIHERLTTHGLKNKYIQPFKSEEFVFLHNGVLSDYVKGDSSDSYNFFECFKKDFKALKKGNRGGRITLTLKGLLNHSAGSWSILIFDKKEKCIYYLKNDSTGINFFRSEDKSELYITTEGDNKNFLDIYNPYFKPLNIGSYVIYKIKVGDKKIKIRDVGRVQKKVYINEWNINSYGITPTKKKSNRENDLKFDDWKKTFNVYMGLIKHECKDCPNKTFNTLGDLGVRLCDECLMIDYFNFQQGLNKEVSYV